MFGGADPSIIAISSRPTSRSAATTSRGRSRGREKWQVKNLLETKNVRRLLVEGNVFENNWSDAQDGFAFVLKSENPDGTAPWSTSSDITIRDNRIRNTGSVFNFARPAATRRRSFPPRASSSRNNIVEAVNSGPYNGRREGVPDPQTGCRTSSSRTTR